MIKVIVYNDDKEIASFEGEKVEFHQARGLMSYYNPEDWGVRKLKSNGKYTTQINLWSGMEEFTINDEGLNGI